MVVNTTSTCIKLQTPSLHSVFPTGIQNALEILHLGWDAYKVREKTLEGKPKTTPLIVFVLESEAPARGPEAFSTLNPKSYTLNRVITSPRL